MALFLGQDSARYAHSFKNSDGRGISSYFIVGFVCLFCPPKVPAFLVASPNSSRPYMAVGGCGGEDKVAAERKRACNGEG